VISKLAQALQLVYPSTGGSPLLYDDNENGYATISPTVGARQTAAARHAAAWRPNGSGLRRDFTDTTQ
jgi:hypothetical protein